VVQVYFLNLSAWSKYCYYRVHHTLMNLSAQTTVYFNESKLKLRCKLNRKLINVTPIKEVPAMRCDNLWFSFQNWKYSCSTPRAIILKINLAGVSFFVNVLCRSQQMKSLTSQSHIFYSATLASCELNRKGRVGKPASQPRTGRRRGTSAAWRPDMVKSHQRSSEASSTGVLPR
jgi:hypothetical protein